MKLLKKHKYILIIALMLLVAIGVIAMSQRTLTVSNYTLTTSNVAESVRILHLVDLHNSEFGEDNADIVAKCREQDPDIILMPGDLINMNESDTDVATDLISELKNIAPVYVSLGNHEIDNEQNFGTDCESLFEETGAIVLDRECVDIAVNGQEIRLGGIYGYCLPAKFLKTKEADPEECAFLTDFQNTDRYTILMAHMPVCWMINEGLDEWDIDCVFSGHAHGGQIILPFIGGLYAPDMGFFPGDLQGVFDSKDNTKHLVLSRGLSSGTWVPRINNKPEIVMVEIKPTQEVK